MKTIKELWGKLMTWMKPFLTIKGIYSFLTSKTFLVIVILIIVLMLGRSCARNRDVQRINDINIQNIAALTDDVKVERRKNGRLELSVASYIATEKDLKKLNGELYNEVIVQKGRVLSLSKIIMQLKQDTAELRSHINYLESIMGQPIQVNDSTFQIPWLLKYDWDSTNFDIYNGQTFIGLNINPEYTWRDAIIHKEIVEITHYKTEMVDRLSQVDLVFGQKIEDNQLRVFVTTKYPGFTASSLSGVLIDPNTNPYIKDLMKKKKWMPNTWSVGVGPSVGYNVLSNKGYLGIGINVNYNLLQW
jgi:hypothetical protein